MTTKVKNKFIERFNTKAQIINEQSSHQQSSVSQFKAHNIKRFQSPQIHQQHKIEDEIIKRLQKHIEYLENKLNLTQKQYQKNQAILHRAIQKNNTKEIEIDFLEKKYHQIVKALEKEKLKLNLLQSDYQKLELQLKISKIEIGLEEQKRLSIKQQLRHPLHKPGKFSNSMKQYKLPYKLSVKTVNNAYKNILIDQKQTQNNESPIFLPQSINFSDGVEKETKKIENHTEQLPKKVSSEGIEMIQQQNKQLQHLQEQLSKDEQKVSLINSLHQNQIQNPELNFGNLIEELNSQRINSARLTAQNHHLLNKLKEDQLKIVDLSILIQKFKTNVQKEGKININRDQTYLNRDSIQFDQQIRALNIEIDNKNEQIAYLKGNLQQKTKAMEQLINQSTALECVITNLNLQISKSVNDIQKVKMECQKSNLQVEKLKMDNESLLRKMKQKVYNEYDFDSANERQQIMEQIKQLMDLNQEQKLQIASLREQKDNLLKYISEQKESQSNLCESQSQNNCSKCHEIQHKLINSQDQCLKLTIKIQKIEAQRDHFNNALNQTLESYKIYERQSQKQIQKLKQELFEKEIQNQELGKQIEDKCNQLERKQDQLQEYYKKMNGYDQEIQSYELKFEMIKEQMRLYNPNDAQISVEVDE